MFQILFVRIVLLLRKTPRAMSTGSFWLQKRERPSRRTAAMLRRKIALPLSGLLGASLSPVAQKARPATRMPLRRLRGLLHGLLVGRQSPDDFRWILPWAINFSIATNDSDHEYPPSCGARNSIAPGKMLAYGLYFCHHTMHRRR